MDQPDTEPRRGPADATDVIEGEIGDSSIKDPSVHPDIGADLEALPTVNPEPPDGPPPAGDGDEG